MPNGELMRVNNNRAFLSGEKIRIHFQSNVDGRLMIFQQEKNGVMRRLYPDSRINGGDNRIMARVDTIIPSATAWLTFDDDPGEERLTVFLATEQGYNDLRSQTAAPVDQVVLDPGYNQYNAAPPVQSARPQVGSMQNSRANNFQGTPDQPEAWQAQTPEITPNAPAPPMEQPQKNRSKFGDFINFIRPIGGELLDGFVNQLMQSQPDGTAPIESLDCAGSSVSPAPVYSPIAPNTKRKIWGNAIRNIAEQLKSGGKGINVTMDDTSMTPATYVVSPVNYTPTGSDSTNDVSSGFLALEIVFNHQ